MKDASKFRSAYNGLATSLIAGALLFGAAPADAQEEEVSEMAMEKDEATQLIDALEREDLTVFARFLEAANLEDDLAGDEKLTFFVPRNAAYNAIAAENLKGVENARAHVFHLTSEDTETYFTLLQDDDAEEDLDNLRPFGEVGSVSLELKDGRMVLRDTDQTAYIIGDPIRVGDHVIHVIDTVLLPEHMHGMLQP